MNEAALPVPPLRPGVGVKQIDARERTFGKPVEQRTGVAEMQPDILERIVLDRDQRFADGVDETVRADEADARMGLGLRNQMLGAAEADFQPHRVDIAEHGTQIGGRWFCQIERERRQQRLEQRGLARAQRMALAPPEEGALEFLMYLELDPYSAHSRASRNPGPRV